MRIVFWLLSWASRRRPSGVYVSDQWMRDRERLESRIEYHGPSWDWAAFSRRFSR